MRLTHDLSSRAYMHEYHKHYRQDALYAIITAGNGIYKSRAQALRPGGSGRRCLTLMSSAS